ncbi:hypothetical protein FB451DRAFT_1187892 [Mycena latifolia]|nr:hypothetical protein FB451DRAFT_1187892 [Mycena latifolia]
MSWFHFFLMLSAAIFIRFIVITGITGIIPALPPTRKPATRAQVSIALQLASPRAWTPATPWLGLTVPPLLESFWTPSPPPRGCTWLARVRTTSHCLASYLGYTCSPSSATLLRAIAVVLDPLHSSESSVALREVCALAGYPFRPMQHSAGCPPSLTCLQLRVLRPACCIRAQPIKSKLTRGWFVNIK